MKKKTFEGRIEKGSRQDMEVFVSEALPIIEIHEREGNLIKTVANSYMNPPWDTSEDSSEFIKEENARIEVFVKNQRLFLPFQSDSKIRYYSGDHLDESNYYIINPESNNRTLIQVDKVENIQDKEYGIKLPLSRKDGFVQVFSYDDGIEYKGQNQGLQVIELSSKAG